MNGAESMLQTLLNQGVEVCFTNPGTSEMHMVAAIGKSDGMRAILALFEGVCSGAADGYGRMAGKPACTLLHLGPGLSNASANLHNAMKANSPILNLIGDHATYHKPYDAPLTSDVIGLAKPVSHWVRRVATAAALPADAAAAVCCANEQPGKIATLIIPADCAWDESVAAIPTQPLAEIPKVTDAAITEAKTLLLNGKSTLLLLNNLGLGDAALLLADKIARFTGARLFCDTFTSRLPRGAGRPSVERLGYFIEQASEQIKDVEQLIMVGTKAPVAFFAYPGKASTLYLPDSVRHILADVNEDAVEALQRLCEALSSETNAHGVMFTDIRPQLVRQDTGGVGSGDLNQFTIGATVAEYMPADAIVVDEGATSGGGSFTASAAAAPHDWLSLTGGSIGFGLPNAIGAAVACPDRKVICLHGDGGSMYTIQSLWTMARENLDICIVIFANRKYQILQLELARVGAHTMNKKTLDLLDIGHPDLDFVKLSASMGVRANRALNIDTFNKFYLDAIQSKGPRLIEVILP